jgi:predicted porin
MAAGAVNGSRWGVKGAEDLGGGLKAVFNFTGGFNSDSGSAAQGGLLFGRYAYVGFTGGFGEVRLGRSATPFDDVSGSSDAVLDSAIAPMNNVFKSTGYTIRTDNTVFYQAPDFGGISGAISYALGENKTATVDAGSTTSLNLTYAGGPLGVQFAYQTEKATGAATAKEFTRLGATYAFGPAVLKATYGKAGNIGAVSGADATDWQLGADYVMTDTLVLSGSVATSSDNATAGDFTRKGFGLGAKYSLSKRTFFYGGYEADTTTKTGVADAKHSVLAAGVQHRF